MRSKDFYWDELDIEFDCPYCDGTGRKEWNELDEDEKKEVMEVYEEEKQGYEDVKTFYYYECESFDFYCVECDRGSVRPMMNYAYPMEYTDVDNESKKIALECGLSLFEYEGKVWMALVGGGMDYSPNILKAYRSLEEEIPAEWAVEWQQDWKANLSEEDHRLNAEACKRSLEGVADAEQKLKAIELYLADPEYVKQEKQKQMENFNKTLDELSEIDNKIIKGAVAISSLFKANEDVTE